MKPVALAILVIGLAGCAASRSRYYWRVRDFALGPSATATFQAPNQKTPVNVKTRTLQKLLQAHFRISRSAGIHAELIITDGEDPNAFAGLANGRPVIAINEGMIRLIGDDIDEYAALLGHESAHWAKGHLQAGDVRSNTIQGIGTLVGVGLGMAGVPAAGLISGFGADLVDTSYSRDDEREADATGLEYMSANGFDPQAAVRLHEKMLKLPDTVNIPFLSSHPSSEERIENLKKLIAVKAPNLP